MIDLWIHLSTSATSVTDVASNWRFKHQGHSIYLIQVFSIFPSSFIFLDIFPGFGDRSRRQHCRHSDDDNSANT